MKLEAEIKNIKKILVDDEKFYQIPDYQRPYSWDMQMILFVHSNTVKMP